METLIYLDTHVCSWLHAGRSELLTKRAEELLESREILISPMVRLELGFLREIGRLKYSPDQIVGSLAQSMGLRICELPFDRVIERAFDQSWTRDPFDRIIVAQAAARDAHLLTRDRQISQSYPLAVW